MKITVISAAGHVHRAQTRDDILGRPLGGNFRWYSGTVYDELANHGDENLTWIRGWHDNDSDEVKALLVARALGPSKSIELSVADKAFIAGTMSEDAWRKNLDLWDEEFKRENAR